MNIAVFCAANAGIDPVYFEKTRELGHFLGAAGHTLVFGGCDVGLMGAIAGAVKESGGRVIGVVPEIFAYHPLKPLAQMDEYIVSHDLSDRKDIMLSRSEAIIALPGGVGTLDEVFTCVAQASVGYHQRRVILYNINHFWDSLFQMLEQWEAEGMLREGWRRQICVANNLEQLEQLIASEKPLK